MTINKDEAIKIAFEAIADKYKINIERPSARAIKAGVTVPYRFEHTTHLFNIFNEGWSAHIAPDAAVTKAARQPVAAAEVGESILKARAEGRAEAMQIIMNRSAEDCMDECIGNSRGFDGEWDAHWKEDKLRELFRVDDVVWSLIGETQSKLDKLLWEHSDKAMDSAFFPEATTTTTPAPASDSADCQTEMLQFLTDVVTAAGLLSHGKTDKGLAQRISSDAYKICADIFADRAARQVPAVPGDKA